MTTKREAAALLRKYDKLRAELRAVEHELAKACADYGRSMGIWGLTRDHLRLQLQRENEGRNPNANTRRVA